MRSFGCLLALAAASCGDTPTCRLQVASPADGALLGPRDDVSNALPGLQVNVTVSAGGVADGTLIALAGNGGAPASGIVGGGQAVFSAFTIAPDAGGRDALVASIGDCRSDPATVLVPSPNLLVAIADPADGFSFGAGDNHNPDPKDLSFVRDVSVVTTADDGSQVALSVNGHAQKPGSTAGGQALFPGVVLPPGAVTLIAAVSDRLGNSSQAQSSGTISTQPPACDLVRFVPGFAQVKGFFTPVLNASVDTSSDAGEQTHAVALSAGMAALAVNVDGQPVATATADQFGVATFDHLTVGEGLHELQLRCTDPAGDLVASPKLAVYVDSIPPACMLASPADAASFGAGDDADPQAPGVQLDARLASSASDVDGRLVSFGVNGVDQGAPLVALSSGAATHRVTLAAPGALTNLVTATVDDSAGNECVAKAQVGLSGAGCALLFLRPAPVAPPKNPLLRVEDDVAPPIGDGLQYDVALEVDQRCVGQRVHLTVDGRQVSQDAPVEPDAGQKLGARVDFPAAVICPSGSKGQPPACTGVSTFFAQVTDPSGATTGATLAVQISSVAPEVTLSPGPPAQGRPQRVCGDTLAPEDDQDPSLPGLQLAMVADTTAALEQMAVTTDTGIADFPPRTLGARTAVVTLPEGYDRVTAQVIDADGNQAVSAPCALSLSGIVVTILSPQAGSAVPAAGVPISGTVSVDGAQVSLYIDGALASGQTASGSAFSFDAVKVPAGAARVLRVDATASGHSGTAQLTVLSDGQKPTVVTDLKLGPVARAAAQLDFTAPSDDNPPLASYLVRWALAPITAPNFASATPAVAPAVAPPGTPIAAAVTGLFAGVPTWFAVAALDRAGNQSTPSSAVEATPDFNRALIAPPADPGELSGKRGFGAAVAGADFDGDGFADLAVGAPNASYSAMASGEGAVYVWFGGKAGLAASPDLILHGPSAGAHAGAALAASDLDGDGKPDLVVAAPDLTLPNAQSTLVAVGAAYLLRGGGAGLVKAMAARALAASADARFAGDPDDPQAAGARLGASVALADFDGDGVADLALGAPGAQSGAGASLVVAGGVVPATVKLPADVTAKTIRGWRLLCGGFPQAAKFGDALFDAGPLGGAGDLGHELWVGSPTIDRAAIFTVPAAGTVDVDGATRALALLTDAAGSGLGGAASASPDSDANGYGEVALGEPLALSGAGRLLRLDGAALPGSGGAVDVSAAASATIAGGPGDALGAAVAALLDANGDGMLDLVFAQGGHGGQLRARWGASPFSQSAVAALFAPANGSLAARLLTVAGDLDGDGLPDLILADPTYAAGAGRIELYR